MKQSNIKIAVIGAGVRGTNLARKVISSGTNSSITAVAEPDNDKRASFCREFDIEENHSCRTWEDLVTSNIDCNAVIIATLDNQHSGPALAAIGRRWHILIEKPLADTFVDCLRIVKKQKENGNIIAVCHTLRFMEAYKKVHKLVSEGVVGEIIHIEHMEAISNVRFAHNYVRSRWAAEKTNTFLLLHKCSHDIDYICWLVNDQCTRVSSFGSLKYFREENAPEGSAERCTGGCTLAGICPYDARKLYVDTSLDKWPARDVSNIHTPDKHLEAVMHGPYGRCVWKSENDVVDHQVVMMEFSNGATATCTLTGYSATNGRRIRVQGTKGELLFDESNASIHIREFHRPVNETIHISPSDEYHPEDQDIVNEWIKSLSENGEVTVSATEALRTHAVVFAAELSRKETRTIEMKTFLES